MAKMPTHEEFIARLEKTRPDVEVLGTYEGNLVPIRIRCRACGLEREVIPKYLKTEAGCPGCRGRIKHTNRKTNKSFLEKLARVNPEIAEVMTEYKGTTAPITVRCPHCKKPWTTTPSILFAGATSCGCNQFANVSRNLTDNLTVEDGTCVERTISNIAGVPRRNSSSGVTGVTKSRGGWLASMEFKGEYHFLGRYRTIEEAASARRRFEDDVVIPWLEGYFERSGKPMPKTLVDRIREMGERAPAD